MRYGAVITAERMTVRLRQYKQLMNIGDLGIAERVIVNFRRAGVEDIVMVTGYNAENLEKSLKKFNVDFVRNPDYETSQMLDSAKLGFEHIRGNATGSSSAREIYRFSQTAQSLMKWI